MHLLHICFICSVEKLGLAPKPNRNVSTLICMYVVDKCNLQFNPIPLACPLRKKTKTKKPGICKQTKTPKIPNKPPFLELTGLIRMPHKC